MSERRFPIQGLGVSLPWSVVAPFEGRAGMNHGGQTLERLADRQGLSPTEVWCLLHGRRYWDGPVPSKEEADKFVLDLVAKHDARAVRILALEQAVRDLIDTIDYNRTPNEFFDTRLPEIEALLGDSDV